jgi:hypothetical protein
VWCHDFSLFLFGKAKQKESWRAFNRNWEQIYRALMCFAYFKTYPLGFWYVSRLNASEWVLNTPLMLLNVRKHLWVIANSPWAPIECAWMLKSECTQPLNTIKCAWMPLSECEHPLSEHEYHWVIIEHESLWCDHEKDCHCVTIEQPLNAIDCAGRSLIEYWTSLECYWVGMNTFEWAQTAPKHPLSTHECLWISLNEHL